MIGTNLGHYRIVEQVGAGGVGVVYLARDERLERDVAIKLLLPRHALTGAVQRSFRREALALSRANHPNIAIIHDFDSQDGLEYIVMEYIEGHPLSAHVLNGALGARETIDWGCQLADGLAFAHDKGVVHGDLKPGNIRITLDGRLKILDFGLARLRTSSDSTTQTMTGTGGLGGTLPYMAPEQIKGQLADQRTDVYAAGAVLYEMATGRRPFNATNDAALISAILMGRPDPPTESHPEISPGLNAIVLKAMDIEPSLRYQSATELQVDLHRLSGRAVSDVVPRRSHRMKIARALIAAGAVALMLVGIWRFIQPEPPAVAPARETLVPTSFDSRLRVELAAPEIVDPVRDEGWSTLIRALLASELAGMQEISLLDRDADSAAATGRRDSRNTADLAVRLRVLAVGKEREVQCSVVDVATQVVNFSTRTAVASESELPGAIKDLAGALGAFFRVRANGPEFARDLLPWISARPYKSDAVTAFVQGAMYVFQFQPGEPRRYFQRALEIDPTFVAPRIWRLPRFIAEGKGGEELAYLRSIEAQVSPFEQAMIAFGGALSDGNLAAQARHLEVALKYAPGNRPLLTSLGSVQEAQGDCGAALATWRPLIESKWAYAPLYSQWAPCAIQLGRIDETRQVLEGSLSLVPPWPDTYAFLDALAILRNDSSASQRYSDLIAQRLKDIGGTAENATTLAKAYGLVGQYALQNNAPGEAILLFQRAIAFNKSEAVYRDRLADTFEKLGRMEESRRERDQAATLRGKNRDPGGR